MNQDLPENFNATLQIAEKTPGEAAMPVVCPLAPLNPSGLPTKCRLVLVAAGPHVVLGVKGDMNATPTSTDSYKHDPDGFGHRLWPFPWSAGMILP
jgi:hypothetical protein